MAGAPLYHSQSQRNFIHSYRNWLGVLWVYVLRCCRRRLLCETRVRQLICLWMWCWLSSQSHHSHRPKINAEVSTSCGNWHLLSQWNDDINFPLILSEIAVTFAQTKSRKATEKREREKRESKEKSQTQWMARRDGMKAIEDEDENGETINIRLCGCASVSSELSQ